MKHQIRRFALALLAAATAQAQSPPPAARTYTSSPVDTAHGDREAWLLWPDGAPGAHGSDPEDAPKLTVYLASPKSINSPVLTSPESFSIGRRGVRSSPTLAFRA